MAVQSGPPNKYGITGHNWNGPLRDGYRVCSVCDFHENERNLPHFCGPAATRLAELEAENEGLRATVDLHHAESKYCGRCGWTAATRDEGEG